MSIRRFYWRIAGLTPFEAADRDLGERKGEPRLDRVLYRSNGFRRGDSKVYTYLSRRDADTIAVQYASTDVVTYHRDGSITLHSGGYYTVTTKARIKEYSPLRVWQQRGAWWCTLDGYECPLEFRNGMRIDRDGVVHYPGDEPLVAVARRAHQPEPESVRAKRAREALAAKRAAERNVQLRLSVAC